MDGDAKMGGYQATLVSRYNNQGPPEVGYTFRVLARIEEGWDILRLLLYTHNLL